MFSNLQHATDDLWRLKKWVARCDFLGVLPLEDETSLPLTSAPKQMTRNIIWGASILPFFYTLTHSHSLLALTPRTHTRGRGLLLRSTALASLPSASHEDARRAVGPGIPHSEVKRVNICASSKHPDDRRESTSYPGGSGRGGGGGRERAER